MTMPTIRAAEILRDFAPLSPGDSITLNWEEANALFDAARRGVEAEGAIGNLKTACEVSNRVAHERAERAEADRDAAAARERDGICDFLERWAVLHDGADFEFDRLIDEIRARADQPELPSAADDEATRWRHGEPTDQRGPAAIGETGRAHGPTPDNHADAAGEQSGPHPTEGGKS